MSGLPIPPPGWEPPNNPPNPPAPKSPADLYAERLGEIEEEYQNTIARADGDYSRIQAYSGLVRGELLKVAFARRQTAQDVAALEYGQAVTTQPEQETT